MSVIRVDLDRNNNTVSIYNNGRGIPIEIHAVEKIYVPELIFGHLLTSSNYDDDEKKVTGGRNGYGAKLCNIFSSEFIVETCDSSTKKRYKQIFSNNMSIKGDPIITKSMASDEEFTKITFKPDLDKFGLTSIDDDHEALFYKRVYDIAGTIRKVKVFLNGEHINIKSFKEYAEMYVEDTQNMGVSEMTGDISMPLQTTKLIHEAINDRWEVCVGVSEGQFQQISFVNSIYTYKGGTHVNYIVDQVTSYLTELIKKKNKTAQFKPFQIKNHLWIFINCLIENPSFDSQTKENMTLRVSSFGSKCDLSDEFLKKVTRTGIVDNILSWVKSKQDKELKKTDGHKFSRLSGIPKLDDANYAGTKQASKCTLILTEGDSAKALAVSGLSVVGRDHFGVYPLRGKLLNVREASHKQIMDNIEINQVKQILGLQHGKIYCNTDNLRYGHIMIMTDQDHDGSHIKGLLINFLDYFWPSLLKVGGFLTEFITPIVKATKGREELVFYTIPEYEKWKCENNDGRDYFIKYYKGLGTSTAQDAKKYFSAMNVHMKSFSIMIDDERILIDMAFSKKKADERKDWLNGFVPGTFIDHSVSEIAYSDFIHRELILFSMADNIRSIPSAIDGLKPGLRKILYACFKRKLKNEIKVAQLSGYIAEHTAYHHGDQSLCASIVGMAQDFVGSNNINILFPSGQFGTRIQGGKDAASPRYIFTKLSFITRNIFIIDDDPLLVYLNDDGQSIEPEWYIPIVPMILINGSEGIGTGWSTYIPNFSPLDIISNLLRKIEGKPQLPMHPWYKGFRGTIEELSEDRYRLSGNIQKVNSDTVKITELPIGMWIQTYKEFLESAIQGTEKNPAWVLDFKEYHTDTVVSFVVRVCSTEFLPDDRQELLKKFKLSLIITLSNMVAFDRSCKLKRFASANEILEDFYDVRLEFYQKRKEYQIKTLNMEWERLENKMRFILEIIDGSLVISKKKKRQLIAELSKRGYSIFNSENTSEKELSQDENEIASGNEELALSSYDYLLNMSLWSLTFERLDKLAKERDTKKTELEELIKKTPTDLWRTDLLNLQKELLDESSDYSFRMIVSKDGDDISISKNESINQVILTPDNKSIKKKKVTVSPKNNSKSKIDSVSSIGVDDKIKVESQNNDSGNSLTERIQMMLSKHKKEDIVVGSKPKETEIKLESSVPELKNVVKKSMKGNLIVSDEDDSEMETVLAPLKRSKTMSRGVGRKATYIQSDSDESLDLDIYDNDGSGGNSD